jgi:very-short-patch-repair endonuclease
MDLMLIIEVDGITHDDEDVLKYDDLRQEALQKAGFTVLRFADEDVLTAIDQVKEIIEEWVDNKGIPPPNPRQRGR